jgi:glycosyltransferase involved in cell wall biosynthesis
MEQNAARKPVMAPSPEALPRRRIRLLIVNSTLHIGGAEQVAASLAQHVNRELFDVSACYLKQPGLIAEQMWRSGVDLVPIPGLGEGRKPDYFSSLKLRRLVKERGIDVIHTHDIHGFVDGSICRISTPGLRHVHTFHFGNYPHRGRWNKFLEGTLCRFPDALVAVGHAQAETIRAIYPVPKNRMRVLWNGVPDPAEKAHPAPIEGVEKTDVPMIASVSTLIRQKGLEHLLNAAAILRDGGDRFRLVIAGHGVLLEPLKAQAARLNLEGHVQFLGWVPQASERLLPLCDIFVQSSLWEAMSVVVLEAMAAGKPMVVTTVGENPHVVKANETALTVPPGDEHALAESLRTLLRDRERRQKLGAAARARYEELFTTQHMIERHEALYRELVTGR